PRRGQAPASPARAGAHAGRSAPGDGLPGLRRRLRDPDHPPDGPRSRRLTSRASWRRARPAPIIGSMNEERIHTILRESLALKQRFFSERARLLVQVGNYLADALRGGRKLLVFGNGGSAADAQHFAAELVGRYLVNRRGLPALALTTDPSIVTAVGNDLGFEQVFARQVEAQGQRGDVAIAISTSGRSPNVLAALRLARERGLGTVGLTGNGGGQV